MKKLLLILFFLSFISCENIIKNAIENTVVRTQESTSDKAFSEVKIDSLFSISLPKYMKEMNNLNEDASLQYANVFKELYSIVIVEKKEEFIEVFKQFNVYNDSISLIENYKDIQLNIFSEEMKIYKTEEYGLIQINDLNARQVKVFGEIDAIKIGYLLTFIETEDSVYFLMNWTLLNRFEKYEGVMELITGSFKPI